MIEVVAVALGDPNSARLTSAVELKKKRRFAATAPLWPGDVALPPAAAAAAAAPASPVEPL